MNIHISLKRNIPTVYYIVFVAVILGSLFLWQMSVAQTDTVAATVTAINLAVSVTDSTIAFGTISLNTSSTTATAGNDTQTVTNDGSTAMMQVKTSNATNGTAWVVGASAASNIYKMEVSTTTGSSYMGMDAVDTYITASSSMTSLLTDTLDFRITTPTVSDDFVEKSITITVGMVSL